MHRVVSKTILFIVLFLVAFGYSNESERSTIGCHFEETEIKQVYAGWPVAMSCFHLIAALRRNINYGLNGVGNLTCLIIDPVTNRTLWSKPMDKSNYYDGPKYYTTDLTGNSPTTYQINIKPSNATCYYSVMKLNVTKQPEETCADNQKKYPIVPTEGRKGQIKSMECTTPLEIEPQLDLTKEMHDYNVTWYLNCTELHPKRRPDVYHMMGSKLTISSLDFSIVGIYSCKITYNGHTRHPIAFSLCAKPPTQTSKPTIRCPKLVKAKIGESVKISCNVSVGYSAVSTFAMEGSWQQINRNKTYSCSHAGISTMHGWKEKAQCYSNVSQEHNDRCYLYEPTVREKEPIENILQMTLEIRDIQPDDFGEISVSYTYFEENATDKINLDYQSRIILSGYMYTVIVLSIVVGILLVILLFIMFRRIVKRASPESYY